MKKFIAIFAAIALTSSISFAEERVPLCPKGQKCCPPGFVCPPEDGGGDVEAMALEQMEQMLAEQAKQLEQDTAQ